MGCSISHLNNRLSFDYAEYVRERTELSLLLRAVAKTLELHRTRKEKMQIVSGASSVTAGVAGAVAFIAAPATFGLSLPIVATTVGIVGNSIAAASITSSAASFGHGLYVNKDIVKRLENLQCIMDSISRKDAEIHALIQSMDHNEHNQNSIETVLHARDKFDKKISFADDDKAKNGSLAAWSILSPGTFTLLQGKNQFKSEQEFEEAIVASADKVDQGTAELQQLANSKFKYIDCVPDERLLSRGRLTLIDDSSTCARTMMVRCHDPLLNKKIVMESDSTKTIHLPEGATKIKVTFFVNGGNTVKRINRYDPKQPWIKSDKGEHLVDVFDLECGDGVDVVFFLKGTFANSYVHKAWDFGRYPSTKPRQWEWWPLDALEKDRKELLPDSERRSLDRTQYSYDYEPCCVMPCGSCFGNGYNVVEPIAQ